MNYIVGKVVKIPDIRRQVPVILANRVNRKNARGREDCRVKRK